jgi:hypothetical protein
MSRIDRVRTPVLALIASAAAEALFITLFFAFRNFTAFGTPLNGVSRMFILFHLPAATVTDLFVTMDNGNMWQDMAGLVICFCVAWAQWWIIFLVSIALFRRRAIKAA